MSLTVFLHVRQRLNELVIGFLRFDSIMVFLIPWREHAEQHEWGGELVFKFLVLLVE
jgi:hypothetical protein